MKAIKLATVVEKPTRIAGANVCPTYKGSIKTPDGYCIAYIKLVPPRMLLAEAVCAVIGRAAGLPIPEPFIGYIPDEFLQFLEGPGLNFAFCSEDAQSRSFQHFLTSKGAARALPILLQWDDARLTAVFDELVANGDRHLENILFDGEDFTLIDHSHALNGPNWNVNILAAGDSAARNQVADRLLYAHGDGERQGLIDSARQAQRGVLPSPTGGALAGATQAKYYIESTWVQAANLYLQSRHDSRGQLMANRVGLPDMMP